MPDLRDKPASLFDYLWLGFWAVSSTIVAIAVPIGLLAVQSDESKLAAEGVKGVGVVIGRQCKTSSSGHQGTQQTTQCRHKVRFTAAKGGTHTFVEPVPLRVKVGQQVAIRYMADDPSHARIATRSADQGMTINLIIAGVIGLAGFIGALFFWRAVFRLRKRGKPRAT